MGAGRRSRASRCGWPACSRRCSSCPIALAYVWMATAMPRSGGDYVFQSRVLGGAIGFPIVMSGFVDLDPAVGRAGRLAVRHPRPRAAVHGPRRALQQHRPHQRRRLVPVASRASSSPASSARRSWRSCWSRASRTTCACSTSCSPAPASSWSSCWRSSCAPTRPSSPWRSTTSPASSTSNPAYYTWLQQRRHQRRLQPAPEVRARGHAAGRADRLDQHAVGHLQRGAGRRDQGRARLQEPDVHHRRLADRRGRRPGAHRLGRAAGRGHRLLQRRLGLLLRRGQRVGQRASAACCPSPACSPS